MIPVHKYQASRDEIAAAAARDRAEIKRSHAARVSAERHGPVWWVGWYESHDKPDNTKAWKGHPRAICWRTGWRMGDVQSSVYVGAVQAHSASDAQALVSRLVGYEPEWRWEPHTVESDRLEPSRFPQGTEWLRARMP